MLTTILSAVKDGLQTCDEIYSTSGVNQTLILKNSNDLLLNFRSQSLQFCSNIKTFGFSTLYTTIPHAQFKDWLQYLIKQSFLYKNGNRGYKFLVLGLNKSYFVKNHTDSIRKYRKDDIIKMLDFLIDNIFVELEGLTFQQTVGISIVTNCAPLLVDNFFFLPFSEYDCSSVNLHCFTTCLGILYNKHPCIYFRCFCYGFGWIICYVLSFVVQIIIKLPFNNTIVMNIVLKSIGKILYKVRN